MKVKQAISKQVLVFSKWSRKGYAIFASLHREVVIARLSVDICITSLLKNSSIISLLNLFTNSENSEDDLIEEETECLESIREQLTASGLISIDNPNIGSIELNNNSKPIFCMMQDMGFLI